MTGAGAKRYAYCCQPQPLCEALTLLQQHAVSQGGVCLEGVRAGVSSPVIIASLLNRLWLACKTERVSTGRAFVSVLLAPMNDNERRMQPSLYHICQWCDDGSAPGQLF